jgi:hypothetical protein
MIKLTKILQELSEKDFPDKGTYDFQGLPITIENKVGDLRAGVEDVKNNTAKIWVTKMQNHYGRIENTKTVDGDAIDVYVGPDHESEKVFIISQNDPDSGKFDEYKVMLGFDAPKEAKRAYLIHYDSPDFFGKIQELTIEEFKEKLGIK